MPASAKIIATLLAIAAFVVLAGRDQQAAIDTCTTKTDYSRATCLTLIR